MQSLFLICRKKISRPWVINNLLIRFFLIFEILFLICYTDIKFNCCSQGRANSGFVNTETPTGAHGGKVLR